VGARGRFLGKLCHTLKKKGKKKEKGGTRQEKNNDGQLGLGGGRPIVRWARGLENPHANRTGKNVVFVEKLPPKKKGRRKDPEVTLPLGIGVNGYPTGPEKKNRHQINPGSYPKTKGGPRKGE